MDLERGFRSSVEKGTRGMPRHREARKDVVSCEKPGGGARIQRSPDVRMGQPGRERSRSFRAEFIGAEGQRRELKHLSTCRKRNQPRCPQ